MLKQISVSILTLYSYIALSEEATQVNINEKLQNPYTIKTKPDSDPTEIVGYEKIYANEVIANGYKNREVLKEIVESGVAQNEPKMVLLKANMLYYGVVYDKNIVEAEKYYKESNNLGEDSGLVGLANISLDNKDLKSSKIYLNGFYQKNKTKNTELYIGKIYYSQGYNEESIDWLSKAANTGSDKAQSLLARIYKDKGDKQNEVKWLIASTKNGNEESFKILNEEVNSDNIKTKNKIITLTLLEKLYNNESNSYEEKKLNSFFLYNTK